MSRKMPAQRPGKSEQTVCTPPEFLNAVREFLTIENFHIDLAALPENAVVGAFLSPSDDALSLSWSRLLPRNTNAWGWLNPPYSNIRPWAQKAFCCHRQIAMLVPASVGSEWWNEWVDGAAYVLFLRGRLKFVGHTNSYPKDLALVLYDYGEPGYRTWKWKDYV